MQLGVTDHVWSVRELIEVALGTDDETPPPRPEKVAPRLYKAKDIPGDQEPREDPRRPEPKPETAEPVSRKTKAPWLRVIDGEKE
jgi:hypothetical protein